MDRESSAYERRLRRVRVCSTASLIVLVVAAGCAWTQSDFAKTATDVASTLAAAETTLRLRHEDRLTRAYSQASFENYREAVEGTTQRLSQLAGAPERAKVDELVQLLDASAPVLERPCLDDGCDWQAQVATLTKAKDAFHDAAGP